MYYHDIFYWVQNIITVIKAENVKRQKLSGYGHNEGSCWDAEKQATW